MERKTAEEYISSIHALMRYIGRYTLDVNEITYSFLVGFREWLEAENGKGCRAASKYLSCLRHIHNLARDEFNDEDVGITRIPRQPFKKGLIPPEPVTEHRVLTVDQMRAVMQCEPVTERGRLAKDVFLLSFYLVGMNTIDIYYIIKGDVKDGVLTYNRHKTDSVRADKAVMKVRIENEALEIMERHYGKTMLLDFADRYSTHMNFNQNVNKGLKKIGEAIGIPKLNTYYARHTWATIARNVCGVDKYTVHESLVHSSRGSERVTDIYLERDFKRIWEANRKVIDVLHVKQQRV
jgi:integrase